MLMHYLRMNWSTFQDRNSFNRLLRVAQKFVTEMIDKREYILRKDVEGANVLGMVGAHGRTNRLSSTFQEQKKQKKQKKQKEQKEQKEQKQKKNKKKNKN